MLRPLLPHLSQSAFSLLALLLWLVLSLRRLRPLLAEAYSAGGALLVIALVVFYLLILACGVALLGLAVYLLLGLAAGTRPITFLDVPPCSTALLGRRHLSRPLAIPGGPDMASQTQNALRSAEQTVETALASLRQLPLSPWQRTKE